MEHHNRGTAERRFITCKDHLGAGNILLGVGEVLIQGVLVPGDPFVLVGLQYIQ